MLYAVSVTQRPLLNLQGVERSEDVAPREWAQYTRWEPLTICTVNPDDGTFVPQKQSRLIYLDFNVIMCC